MLLLLLGTATPSTAAPLYEDELGSPANWETVARRRQTAGHFGSGVCVATGVVAGLSTLVVTDGEIGRPVLAYGLMGVGIVSLAVSTVASFVYSPIAAVTGAIGTVALIGSTAVGMGQLRRNHRQRNNILAVAPTAAIRPDGAIVGFAMQW